MAQSLLNQSQVRGLGQQPIGQCMPEAMRGDSLGDIDLPRALLRGRYPGKTQDQTDAEMTLARILADFEPNLASA